MGVAEFVAGVDRLLTRAHELFPAGGQGVLLPASGVEPVLGSAGGAGGLRDGALGAAASYQRVQIGVAGLDEELQAAAAQGGAIGAQGRVASGLIRDQSRATAATLMPLAKSPAGAQLVMAAMDQHLAAMQGQLASTKSQYQGVSAALQQVAAGYRTLSNGASTSPGDAQPIFSGGKIGGGPGPPMGIVWCRAHENGGFTCRELLPDGTIAIFSSPTDISGHWPD